MASIASEHENRFHPQNHEHSSSLAPESNHYKPHELVLPALVRLYQKRNTKKASVSHKNSNSESTVEHSTVEPVRVSKRHSNFPHSRRRRSNGASSSSQVVLPRSGRVGNPESCFFMACLAPSHDAAFQFLKTHSTLTNFVFVFDEQVNKLYLTGLICNQQRIILLLSRLQVLKYRVQAEWESGADPVKKKQDDLRNKTRLHLLSIGNMTIFDRLQFLWHDFLPFLQLFLYETSHHGFFQIENHDHQHGLRFNLREWFLAIVASEQLPERFSNRRQSSKARVRSANNLRSMKSSKSVFHTIRQDTATDLNAAANASAQDPAQYYQIVSILLRAPQVRKNEESSECVIYMAKKLLQPNSTTDPRKPVFKYPLRIIRIDFHHLRVFIRDTFYDPSTPPRWYQRIWSKVVQERTDYEISIKQLNFALLFDTFVESECIAPTRQFSFARFASASSASFARQGSFVLKQQQRSSAYLRQSLRRCLVVADGQEGNLDEYEQFFEAALQAFDLVNPARRIPLAFQKLLQDFLILLSREEFKHATFTSVTNQLRCRLASYLIEFLAASAESLQFDTETPRFRLLQKHLRLAIAILITRTTENEFFVVYHCMNKLWTQLFAQNDKISTSCWLLLMDLLELDTLCRDFVLERAHELFWRNTHNWSGHYFHVNPCSFQRFVTNHLPLEAAVSEDWDEQMTSLLLVDHSEQNHQVTLPLQDVLPYEVIVTLSDSLFLDADAGINIDQKAAMILNYPDLHMGLFMKILQWTQYDGQDTIAPCVLQVLWQCVSTLHELETYGQQYVNEQMTFAVAFAEELARSNVQVVNYTNCTLLVMMEEYVKRVGSNRVDELVLICLEALASFIEAFAERLAFCEEKDSKSHEQTNLMVKMTYYLVSIWQVLMEKSRTRDLRSLLLRMMNEESFAVHQFLEVVVWKVSTRQEFECIINRFFGLMQAFSDSIRGKYDVPHRTSMIGSVEDRMRAQDIMILVSHFLGTQADSVHTFWHLIVDLSLFLVTLPSYRMDLRFLTMLLELYVHKHFLLIEKGQDRDRLVGYHFDAVQSHAFVLKDHHATLPRKPDQELTRALDSHLQCLVLLAQIPEFHQSFVTLKIAPFFLQLLMKRSSSASRAIALIVPTTSDIPSSVEEDDRGSLTPIYLDDHRKSIGFVPLDQVQPKTSTPSVAGRAQAPDSSSKGDAKVERLQALAVLLILIVATPEPSFEFDQCLCAGSCVDVNLLFQFSQTFLEEKQTLAVKVLDLMIQLQNTGMMNTTRLEKLRVLVHLVCAVGYNDSQFGARILQGKSLLGSIFHSTLCDEQHTPVTIKQISFQDLPVGQCAIQAIYNEVLVLMVLQEGAPSSKLNSFVSSKIQVQVASTPVPWLRLWDFGISRANACFDVVYEWCASSLKELRSELNEQSMDLIQKDFVLLRTFDMICECLQEVHGRGIIHLNVACENVMLRKRPREVIDMILLELEDRFSERVKASDCIALAEFSESLVMPHESRGVFDKARTVDRSRGIDCLRSPEMLFVDDVKTRELEPSFHGEAKTKPMVSFASDIWSLGCLLYEWVTDRKLFGTEQYASLYAHVVRSQGPVLRLEHHDKLLSYRVPKTTSTPDRVDHAAVHKEMRKDVLDLLVVILKRIPSERPHIDGIRAAIQQIMLKLKSKRVGNEWETKLVEAREKWESAHTTTTLHDSSAPSATSDNMVQDIHEESLEGVNSPLDSPVTQ